MGIVGGVSSVMSPRSGGGGGGIRIAPSVQPDGAVRLKAPVEPKAVIAPRFHDEPTVHIGPRFHVNPAPTFEPQSAPPAAWSVAPVDDGASVFGAAKDDPIQLPWQSPPWKTVYSITAEKEIVIKRAHTPSAGTLLDVFI